MSEDNVIDQQVRIDASPEVVFEFLVDPAKLVRWIGVKAELQPTPGGRFWVDMNGRDVAAGQFVEVLPHTRVVFTWGWEKGGAPVPPGASTVEITLIPDGSGTVIHLVHRGLPGPTVAPHADGWGHYLVLARR